VFHILRYRFDVCSKHFEVSEQPGNVISDTYHREENSLTFWDILLFDNLPMFPSGMVLDFLGHCLLELFCIQFLDGLMHVKSIWIMGGLVAERKSVLLLEKSWVNDLEFNMVGNNTFFALLL
jgi:hypothetical protein